MSRATKCLKCLAILCNFLLATTGLVMLAGGIFLMTDSRKSTNENTTKFVNPVEEQRDNWTNSSSGTVQPSPDISAVIALFYIFFVFFGAFITLIGLLGIFGVCCSSRVLLRIYAIVTILLIIAEILVTAVYALEVLNDFIHIQAKYTLREHYVGLKDLGEYSLAWNYIMIEFQCCGLDSYTDFDSAKKWLGNEIDPNLLLNTSQVTPLACCKQAPNFQQLSDLSCSTSPTSQISNWETSCWVKVAKTLRSYGPVTIGIIGAIVVAQALLASMAILIARRLPKNLKDS